MLDATQALTVVAEISKDHRPLLDDRLAAIAADLDHNAVFRPGALPDTHFMRFVVVEDRELPAVLVWEVNHDGHAADYLALVASKTPEIDAVFECCAGYPKPHERDYDTRAAWLLARTLRANAFYTGYRGVPRKRVLNDRRVHDAIRAALDAHGGRAAFSGLPGCEVQRRLYEYVRVTHPDLEISGNDSQEARWLIGKVLAILVALILLGPFLLIAGPWYLALRGKERRDDADVNTRPVHDDKDLSKFEDKVTQNQLTHIVDIKPGWFRLATLRFVLRTLDVIARVYSVRGDLGGIESIHFARWVILFDRRRGVTKRHRLLFFSNYDGSWESYLGEFVDRAAYGLTGVWSNCVGFPRSKHLLGAGARDEEAFKQWTRHHQIETQVWWSGVPDSTVQNIRDDVWIRQNLDRGLGDEEVTAWLRKL